MSIKVKSFHLFLNQVILTASQVIILISASYWLKVEDYGLYKQFFLIPETIIPILGMGLSSSVYYFLTKYRDHKLLLFKLVKYGIIIFIGISLLNLIGGGRLVSQAFNSPDLKIYLVYVAPYTTLMILMPLIHAFFVHNNKTRQLFLINSILSLAYLVITVIVLYYIRSPLFLVLSRTIFLGIVSIILIFFFVKKVENQKSVDVNYSLVALIKYSLPIGLATVVGVISMQVNKFIVSTNFSIKDFAIYSNGAFEIPFLGIVTSTITVVSLSELIKLCENNKFEDAIVLFHKIAELSALILFPVSAFFFIFSSEFIQIMFGPNYVPSIVLFKIFLTLIPIRIIVYGPILLALDKRKVLFFRSLVELILNLALSLILMQKWGLIGIALGNVFSVIFWSVPYNFYHIKKGFNCSMEMLLPYKKLILIGTISFFCVLPFYVLKEFIIFNIVYKFILFFIFYSSLIGCCFLYFKLIEIKALKSFIR